MPWIASLWNSSALWEVVEYTAESAVIIGALFEVLTEFEYILKGDENKHKRHRLGKASAITLIVGLAVGLVALVRTNALFTKEISASYNEAERASGRATAASDRAKSAQDRADKAEGEASKAIDRAGKLALRAAALESDAEHARMEAELIRSDNLKLQEYAIKLQEFSSPRRITMGDKNGDRVVRQARFAEVRKFAGTSAVVQPVPDPEARTLAFDIREALRLSGWNATVAEGPEASVAPGFISSGVQVVTIETIPYAFKPNSMPAFIASMSGFSGVPSKAGRAATALVSLLDLDLGPPSGPAFFGAHWEPQIEGDGIPPVSTRYAFKFPKADVIVLVGLRPIEYMPPPPKAHEDPAKK